MSINQEITNLKQTVKRLIENDPSLLIKPSDDYINTIVANSFNFIETHQLKQLIEDVNAKAVHEFEQNHQMNNTLKDLSSADQDAIDLINRAKSTHELAEVLNTTLSPMSVAHSTVKTMHDKGAWNIVKYEFPGAMYNHQRIETFRGEVDLTKLKTSLINAIKTHELHW